ncbi:MAG: hypothetical protein K0Q87_4580 [Neobacillus sp.]|jgi:hypothetical protein|nr:hypothetical protein [Neobacillus sp.]
MGFLGKKRIMNLVLTSLMVNRYSHAKVQKVPWSSTITDNWRPLTSSLNNTLSPYLFIWKGLFDACVKNVKNVNNLNFLLINGKNIMIIRVGVKNWYLSVNKHNRRGKFF